VQARDDRRGADDDVHCRPEGRRDERHDAHRHVDRGFDTAGALQLENERITYTGKTSTTFTGCTRGGRRHLTRVSRSGTSVTGTRTFELRPTTVSTRLRLWRSRPSKRR
jgi:hypothetical protein